MLKLRGHELTDSTALKSWLAINRGWAAGLVLYSEWARLGQSELGRIGPLGFQAVFDYFAGEIQARVAPQDARLLAESALLPVMKPTLAAELTGIADAGEILCGLHRRNTFTTRYDGPSVAYEFHPLFREYLLKELERTHDQESLIELQHRAADLLARDGQIEAALDLLASARCWTEMAALLRAHVAELINHGRHRLVEKWLAQFPDKAFEALVQGVMQDHSTSNLPSNSRRTEELELSNLDPLNSPPKFQGKNDSTSHLESSGVTTSRCACSLLSYSAVTRSQSACHSYFL